MLARKILKSGDPFIWMTAGCLVLILGMLLTLVSVVVINGIGVFWPNEVWTFKLKDGSKVMGEIFQVNREEESDRLQLKIGNRDLVGLDFRWVNRNQIVSEACPAEVLMLERREYGNFYGFVEGADVAAEWKRFETEYAEVEKRHAVLMEDQDMISDLSQEIEKLRARQNREKFFGRTDEKGLIEGPLKLAELNKEFNERVDNFNQSNRELEKISKTFFDGSGSKVEIPLYQIVRYIQPNKMGFFSKTGYFFKKIRELLFDEPREANTEGGLFPAIVGTVMMIFLMSALSFPMGVMAGIYLKEYSRKGWMVLSIRIAVNNLAGIPSIVFGIFGLGFFIYGIGGTLDGWFYPEKLPTPTFGTGGILWASLTLGLLTVPVVIVATEEALGVIPQGIREASESLGATKFQTLIKVLLPMASPGIMTGFILAMSRAAGEVAPLMITGVVKLAPALPLDGEFPFFHLERKFMHLGFHIYDVGFQSPNVEAAKPLVFVTTLLLLLIVVAMSSGAIMLRSRMKRKFSGSSI